MLVFNEVIVFFWCVLVDLFVFTLDCEHCQVVKKYILVMFGSM